MSERHFINIIIAGDGRVGSTLARQLSAEGYDLPLIDSNNSVLETSMERYDVTAVHDNCAAMATLCQTGVMDADMLTDRLEISPIWVLFSRSTWKR